MLSLINQSLFHFAITLCLGFTQHFSQSNFVPSYLRLGRLLVLVAEIGEKNPLPTFYKHLSIIHLSGLALS